MRGPQGSLRQHRPRPEDAADAAAQPLRGGVARRQGRVDYRARPGENHRGVGRTDPDLRRVADDRPGRVRRIRDGMAEFDIAEGRARRRRAVRAAGRGQGIALQVDARARRRSSGNRELVSQALANLVDNAIKYAAPASQDRQRRRRRRSSVESRRGQGPASC